MPNPTEPEALLDDVLARIRLTGAIFLRAEYREPWAYVSPAADEMVEALHPGASRLILFHIISAGRCRVEVEGGPRVELSAGDVVVLPYGHQHRMSCPGGAPVVHLGTLLPPTPWESLPVIRHGGEGTLTQVVCGYLHTDDPLFHPFLRALPEAFRVRPPEGPAADWVRASIRYALDASSQRQAAATGARLSELLFVEILRQYARQSDQAERLAALRDEVVGRALRLIHADPAHGWTLAELARRSGASRSTLGERFSALLGRSPMRYLAQWRLELAADLLRTTDTPIAGIAQAVGYASEASFNRAFKRHHGAPPARWRDRTG